MKSNEFVAMVSPNGSGINEMSRCNYEHGMKKDADTMRRSISFFLSREPNPDSFMTDCPDSLTTFHSLHRLRTTKKFLRVFLKTSDHRPHEKPVSSSSFLALQKSKPAFMEEGGNE